MSLGSFAGGFARGYGAMQDIKEKKAKAKPATKPLPTMPMGADADKADNEVKMADGGLVGCDHNVGTHASLSWGWQRMNMGKKHGAK